MVRAVVALLVLPVLLAAQEPKRVLYVTHSAGFRHDSIMVSRDVLRDLSPLLNVTSTEDLSLISEQGLRNFDAVLFFTSGELALSTEQKAALLAFVRRGGGFGGVHSATDTLYTWPEYGELIGGYFDGHPWAQRVRINIEDPDHPASTHLHPAFEITEEIYQFRNFQRDRVRVLMTLDVSSVNLQAEGVRPNTDDFPLAWVRNYGQGRVFYSALGHFDGTWRDAGFQQTLRGALLWLTRLADGAGDPRRAAAPILKVAGNAASLEPRNLLAPGALISVFGENLTNGSSAAGSYTNRLAGTVLRLNGTMLPLLYVSPGQINAMVPAEMSEGPARLEVESAGAPAGPLLEVTVAAAAPGVFAVSASSQAITVWATGLGHDRNGLRVMVGGQRVRVLFSGRSPESAGVDQINLEVPSNLPRTQHILEIGFEGQSPFYSRPVSLSDSQ